MSQIATSSGPKNVGMLSVGAYRPERVVSNDEICQNIDSSDEWIYSRTGIKTRRFAADDESAASMATEAGRRAISIASLTPADIDGVIVTTNTHFLQTPPAAPMVASALGAKGVLGFDISAGCAGFGYALGAAADMIRGGAAAKMLVVGTEKLSPTIDMRDRGNCFIFADGAAARGGGRDTRSGHRTDHRGQRGRGGQRHTPGHRLDHFRAKPKRPTPVRSSRRSRGVPLGGIPDGRRRSTGAGRGGGQTR